MKQRDILWKARFSLRLTCVFNTVTLLPLQFTASSRMESTEGVCALIFNVLPSGRGSLSYQIEWMMMIIEIPDHCNYLREMSNTFTYPFVEPMTRYDPLELILFTSPSF